MNKNRIEGGANQGERANDRKALVTKDWWRRSGGECSEGVRSYLGRSRLDPERVTVLSRSEKSAEAVVVRREAGEGLNEKEWNPA
jgi:hypothetical protein